MTKFRGCWDVSRNRRTHYIRSIDGQGWATVSERGVGAMGELGGVVLRVSVQLDASPARPSLGERVGDLGGSKDGVYTFERDGCTQRLDHLLQPRKNVVRAELIDGLWRAYEDGVCALRAWGDGEDEV